MTEGERAERSPPDKAGLGGGFRRGTRAKRTNTQVCPYDQRNFCYSALSCLNLVFIATHQLFSLKTGIEYSISKEP